MDKSLVNFVPADIIGKVCRAEIRTETFQATKQNGEVYDKSKNVIKEMLYPLETDKPEMNAAPTQEANKADAEGFESVPF